MRRHSFAPSSRRTSRAYSVFLDGAGAFVFALNVAEQQSTMTVVRSVSRTVLLALACLTFGSPTLAQEVSPTPKPAGPKVELSLIVTDKSNKSVSTIGKDEIRVIEEKIEQVVESVEPDNRPTDYGLLIDASGSARSMLREIVESAGRIVHNRRASDQIFIERFVSSDKITILQDFTQDNNALLQSLAKLFVEGGHTAVIDALYVAAERVVAHHKNTPGRRKALVIITDGEDRKSSHTLSALIELLRRHDIQVFVLGLVYELDETARAGFINPNAREKAEKLLNRIAGESGGRVFYPKKGTAFDETITQISQDLRSQFRITYQSHDSTKTGFRKVEVKLTSPAGRTAIAPGGYYPGSTAITPKASEPQSP